MKQAFLDRMQILLGTEYQSYIDCMNEKPKRGLRINLLKTDENELQSILPFRLMKTPFARNGYFLPDDYSLKTSIAYAAGLFYVQEPSASSAVSILDPTGDIKVLDLCAAPGSKSTQIAEYLSGNGFLVSNEINRRRAEILRENMEKAGVCNAMMISSDPRDTAELFKECMDAVLCDAPCSGEGMFRKNPEAAVEWTEETPASCALRQGLILDSAYQCLKPGGVLVYSTCTFSREENELCVSAFIQRHPDMKLDPIRNFTAVPRRCSLSEGCVRIYPMDGGEGHFACRMKKAYSETDGVMPECMDSEPIPKAALDFFESMLDRPYPYLFKKHDTVYASAVPFYSSKNCYIIREGIRAGVMKTGRFEPDHALAMSSWTKFKRTIELNDQEASKYLAGETLKITTEKGYAAVTWHDHALGFAKSDGSFIKNRLPKQYRIR
ncbi:MAG: RNA methyltransferase [Erysipelotrichia bacterium]|nr:RNA methyltransferase [Erysipelotrichia bacterium]